MNDLIQQVEHLELDDSKVSLKKFISDYENLSSPLEIGNKDRERLWNALFNQMDGDDSRKLLCLKAVRILSREKSNLSVYVSEERLQQIFETSSITQVSECMEDSSIEALKCLCNITYNLASTCDLLNSYGATLFLAKRLSTFKGRKDLYNRKLFEIKLLFLLTALSVPSRHTLYDEYGLKFFVDLCLEEANISKDSLFSPKRKKASLNEEQIRILCESLKTAFNVLCSTKSSASKEGKDLKEFVSVLRELSLTGLKPSTEGLIRDVINVLTLIPNEFLEFLLVPGHNWNSKEILKNPCMEAVTNYLEFLDFTLVKVESIPVTPKEELSPVLLLLTNLSKSNKMYRRFIRVHILPSLKDTHTRPEVGNTLRNKLCRLLTCPITSTRDLVADFLFVLCKESVSRMVKYTGYGNAAGLFANRGLLAGDPNSRTSSESEDSETEEYIQHKHMINPIVGCVTPPHVDETSNMSDEQKEYLALELVNKIDKLQRDGIIQPCRVGPDGKPVPVDHVLELQDCKLPAKTSNDKSSN